MCDLLVQAGWLVTLCPLDAVRLSTAIRALAGVVQDLSLSTVSLRNVEYCRVCCHPANFKPG